MSESEGALDVPLAINDEAEQSLLGACIQTKWAYRETASLLTPEMFWRPTHATIWQAIDNVHRADGEINPMSVMGELRKMQQLSAVGGGAYLHTLMTMVWQATDPRYAVTLIRQAYRARRALEITTRMRQVMVDQADDHEELLLGLARQVVQMDLLVAESDEDRPITGFSTFDEFIDRPRSDGGVRWLVPEVIMAQDVWMLLAGEGGGKSYLTRQFCFCLGSGIHPFRPGVFVTPVPTLHIDLENPEGLVAAESEDLRQQIQFLGGYRPENVRIWHRPEGLNLRERADQRLLERVIGESEARLVTLGSLYKSFSRRGDSWDQATEEVREVFDRLRAKFDIALMLEHHMPKGDGGATYDRPQTAFGSQQWAGWASVGKIINQVGDNMYRLDSFRKDRGRRHLPTALVRGGELPWTPIWDRDEMEYGMYPEIRAKLAKARGERRAN